MLWDLHLCSVNGIAVLDYHDGAVGTMRENADGSGEFTCVQLKPVVRLMPGDDREKARALHADAHRLCFVARSVKFPVEVLPEFENS
jgi:organic hydroperoxide reductase OsmC/OhrA